MQLALPRDASLSDRPSLEALYDAHVDRLWRLLQRLGVPEGQLEDAVQDVFVIAHRQLARFRGDSSVGTWLAGIAVRVAKDVRRSLARRGPHHALEPDAALDAPGPLPDELSAQREALGQVLALLAQLDEAQREIFVLVELDGLTAPEVSRLLDVNVNTVSTRLRAARQRFNALVAALPERGAP